MAESLRSLISRWGAARAVALGATGVAIVIVLLLVSRWATSPEWLPLVQGEPLETVGTVTTVLAENGIEYRLTQGGSVVSVTESELARARVLLAQQGVPSAGDPGFELFDRPSWGMTDFTQRVNYRRALEGELERSIADMKGVAGARVHLGLAERSTARRNAQPGAASVVLRLEPNARSGAELVDAISSLVASSVDGLTSDRVTVLDDTGRLLSAAIEDGVTSSARKRELALRREVEGYLEQRAEDLVAQVLGPANVRVRVAAELDFARTDRTVQSIDPEQQVTTSEERTEVVAAPGQASGTSATSTTYDVARSTEIISSGGGKIRRLTVAVLLNAAADSTVTDPVALERLVANAVGLDRTRGDSISVVRVGFTAPAPLAGDDEHGIDVLGWIEVLRRPVLGLLALLLVFAFGLRVLRTVRMALRPATPELAAAPVAGELPAQTGPEALLAAENAPLVQSQLNPELAARVLRAWVRES